MYKRGNEDTSIKGRSGGREDRDWEQGQGRCQGDEFTVLKKNTANWNKSRSEYHWQAILIVLCLLVLYLKHSFFAPYTCVFRAETKSSTGSEKYIKKSKNQETPLFSVSPMKRNISPSVQAQQESWSVRLIHLAGLSSQASLPIVTGQAGKLLLASPAQLMCHEVPVGRGFAGDAVTATAPNGSVSHLCAVTFLEHKPCEMSAGCRNLSGRSHNKIPLLKAIERDCFFYCPVKDSARSELEIWQSHPGHSLTQYRRQMLQEDYVSSCALSLQGDYTVRVKGFRGLALQPCRRISLLPAKNIWKAQGIMPSLLYGVSRKCCSQEIFYLQLCQGQLLL